MKYCTKCVQPDTRPNIYFNEEGVCGGCLWKEKMETTIDWNQRQKELNEIVVETKRKAKKRGTPYECAIGVSGGKDSTFQALYARDVLGLRPLLVNCEPGNISEIGLKNIENLKNLGFDTIALRANSIVQKKLIKRDFYDNLNPGRTTEYVLYAVTYIIAQKFDIPLIIQGENVGLTFGDSKSELGTGDDALIANKHNTLIEGIEPFIKEGLVEEDDMFLFHYDANKLREMDIRGIWMNYYVKEYSFQHNLLFSLKNGLTIRSKDRNLDNLGTYNRYSQLDGSGDLLEVNQMMKHVKFGFGQATDHVNYDIRYGLISRAEGIALIKTFDGKCGNKYIKNFCEYIDISEKEFWDVTNSFRGDMWELDDNGDWKLKNPLWEQEPPSDLDLKEIIAKTDIAAKVGK